MVEEAERHGKGVMEASYILKHPRTNAIKHKLLYKNYVGESAPIPTAAELQSKKRCYDEIAAARRSEAHADDDDDDDVAEGTEDAAEGTDDSDVEVVITPVSKTARRVSEPTDLDADSM